MFGIPTPQTLAAKALCYLVGAMVLVGGGAYGGYRFELGRYEQLVSADAKAMTKSVELARKQEQKITKNNQEDAVAQAYFRGKMDATTVNLVLGVPENVTFTQDESAVHANDAGCITFGFVRVLIAGERGEPAESFSIPSGESVDSCTALKPSELAAAVAQDLAAGVANGHQLDSLIVALKRNESVIIGDSQADSFPTPLRNVVQRRAVGLIFRVPDGQEPVRQDSDKPAPAEPVKGDVGQPHNIDAGNEQASPPGQRQAYDAVEPQVIDAPSTKESGGQPMHATQAFVPANGPDIEDLKYGAARFKGRLGDIRVNVHFMLPDW